MERPSEGPRSVSEPEERESSSQESAIGGLRWMGDFFLGVEEGFLLFFGERDSWLIEFSSSLFVEGSRSDNNDGD